MVRRADIKFHHFVIDKEGVIFASARDSSNKIYNFVINSCTGNILEQVSSRFESINGEWAEYVRSKAEQYRGIVPTYRIPHFELS
jgi:hypothetical protein